MGLPGLGSLGGGCMALSSRVAIPVIAMDGLAIPMADAFNTTCFRDHIKGTGRPRQDSPYMRPGLLASRDDRPHQVASLIPMMDFLPLAMPNGKAVPDPTHLPVPMSSRFDQQRHHLARLQVLRGAPADTGGIQPVSFRQIPPDSVVFGQTT